MDAPVTVRPPHTGRRTVRRKRPALDQAYDVALAELPVEIRPLVVQYVDNMRAGQEIRTSLSNAMTGCGVRWYEVDKAAQALTYAT